jgi:hypothetical protein
VRKFPEEEVLLRAGSKVQIELRPPEPSRLMPEIPDGTLAAVADEEPGRRSGNMAARGATATA